MKRALQREFKVREIAEREAVGVIVRKRATCPCCCPRSGGASGCWRAGGGDGAGQKWLQPTRLETRTKECNRHASHRVENPRAQLK